MDDTAWTASGGFSGMKNKGLFYGQLYLTSYSNIVVQNIILEINDA
jgi:hypothetical protein